MTYECGGQRDGRTDILIANAAPALLRCAAKPMSKTKLNRRATEISKIQPECSEISTDVGGKDLMGKLQSGEGEERR